ncbi:uncharacterized protein ASPGLDRAFT_712791 [Aspergillus glaucus CBS 516.65]|uniref:Uncharacterized protein n=1 Tax=Aspergillus glaucus CBS 516.65 TaxID=1160497 RepID=A0A1L9VX78_ASPGL|nr:hypothetical protein ASPGLDRAFT_712791 [Aspergillus glaucus CBS 516.65]OJJ88502.1 hypothetical protein ASPGLDRAFT_712791 [Aspergillus glaucus CBS 516.65]
MILILCYSSGHVEKFLIYSLLCLSVSDPSSLDVMYALDDHYGRCDGGTRILFFSFSVVCLVMFGMGDGVWSPNCSCSMSFLLTRQHAINVTVSTLYMSVVASYI